MDRLKEPNKERKDARKEGQRVRGKLKNRNKKFMKEETEDRRKRRGKTKCSRRRYTTEVFKHNKVARMRTGGKERRKHAADTQPRTSSVNND